MAVEPRRRCGYRKVHGLYLTCGGGGMGCDRLPFPLTVCPTCHAGIKQSRGWTWIDVAGLTGGVHPECRDDWPCPFCMATSEMGKAGLLWIGERFYPTPDDFRKEADRLGICKRISAVPRNFKVGQTWILLAHPRTVCCEACNGSGLAAVGQIAELQPCKACNKTGKAGGIFRIFVPSHIEKLITETESKDPELMKQLADNGITPIVVPDNDKDHQGTVYDKPEDEPEE